MSSLASVFNSASTLLTMDVWLRLRPHTPPHTLVTIGRVATGVMCILSLLWLPLVARGSSLLFLYVQRVSNYLSPPITAVFLLSLWPAAEELPVFAALCCGLVLGFGMCVCVCFFRWLVFTHTHTHTHTRTHTPAHRAVVRLLFDIAAGDQAPTGLASVNFMYFALISATLTTAIAVLGTLCSRHSRTRTTRFSAMYRPAPASSDLADEMDETLVLVAAGQSVATLDPDPNLLASASRPPLSLSSGTASPADFSQQRHRTDMRASDPTQRDTAPATHDTNPLLLEQKPSSSSLSSTTSEVVELPPAAEGHWHVVRSACRAHPGQAASSMAVCATMVFLLAYFA
jgi:hypothetical protein